MPANIGENFIIEDGIARISEDDARRLQRHRMEPGDIVYSRRGDVERRALIREDNAGWLCGTGCLRVHFGSHGENDPAFVSYQLGTEWTREWIVRHAVGATMLNLNTGILSAVPLERPPLHEQRAIAEVLGALDDKIAANSKLASTAEDLARTLALAVPVTVPLGEIVEHIKTTVNPEGLADDRVAHFSLPAFDAGIEPEIVGPQEIKSNKFLVREPSVLVSKLNPRFPRVWNIPTISPLTSLASTEFVTLRPRFSSTTVLWALTSQPAFGAALEAMVAGTSGSHQRVKPAEMLSTLVPDPRTMSDVLVGQIGGLGLRAISSRDENRTLAATRDILLPQLMSGKLRVKDAERIVSEVA
ncbi:restriction endonuclease subunit S [Oerskovia sp. NPDC060338]|uniref:restriction endonuclease subunit S n=1 Tax=Oerskovia sp. NPDC060338 TaxID=3347100 RepID=UPI00364EC2F9